MAWPTGWLRERANALLAIDSTTAPLEFIDAYDNLLWAVVTSERDEFGRFVGLLYQ